MMRALSVTAAVLAWTLASTRWLRVAQREHYLPESVYRFTRRWWTLRPWNISLAGIAIAALGLALFKPSAVLLSSAVLAFGPLGLGLRGRSGALHWTRRLKTLAAFHLAISVILCSLLSLWLSLAVSSSALAILVPLSLELALRLTAPLQRREMDRFVAQAKRKLDALGPRIVGITGSYGKTSTKQHLAHLISTSLETLASPASFNNRAGLARTINEQLSPSHQLFIAEMGTYGIGEIAELCSWCRPDVAVLTAIGPVHLERMGSMAAILDAKLEIAEMAPVVVINVMDKRLGQVVDRLQRFGKEVITTGTAQTYQAQVVVDASSSPPVLQVRGVSVELPGPLPEGVRAGNLASAFAVILGLGLDPFDFVDRVASMPAVVNRATVGVAESGVIVIDDTFNANPEGARSALSTLASAAPKGRRVLVTPGMVELGSEQDHENRDLAAAASRVVDTVVIVGRTNRASLLAGVSSRTTVVQMPTRDRAVAWVRRSLKARDAVLYENDLPDHYP